MNATKIFLALSLITIFSNTKIHAQEEILAGEKWEQLTQQKFLVNYFKDFFIVLGVEVEETGEKITVINKGEFFEIVEGINEEEIDYKLLINTKNVLNLVKYAEDGIIDNEETFKLLSTFFTPMTTMTLKNPIMTKNVSRFKSKIDNITHVTLFSPDKTESVSHTLIFLNKEWIVIPGFHGTPIRVFELSIEQGLDYQKQVFDALNINTKKQWRSFRKWYLKWRKEVSVSK